MRNFHVQDFPNLTNLIITGETIKKSIYWTVQAVAMQFFECMTRQGNPVLDREPIKRTTIDGYKRKLSIIL